MDVELALQVRARERKLFANDVFRFCRAVDVMDGVGTDREAPPSKRSHVLPTHEWNGRVATADVVRESVLGGDDAGRDEERRRDAVSAQDRCCVLVVVQIAVIERYGHPRT